ncbi:hypothetical protein HDV00_000804 [Rhizophlyctis rosea]|nr:hypothetical protein HDV00_000804 [Rhizophlyctis rosea]
MPADVDVLLVKLNRSHLPGARSPAGGRAALNRLKASTKGLGRKLEALEHSYKEQSTSTCLRKHRAIWSEEVGRLDKWRSSLERDIHDDMSAFVAHGGGAQEDVRLVADILEDKQNMDQAQRELSNGMEARIPSRSLEPDNVQDLRHRLDETRAFIKQAGQRPDDAEAQHSTMTILKDAKSYIGTLQQQLDDQVHRAQAEVRTATAAVRSAATIDESITDPWIVEGNDIIRFSDLHCVDAEVEAERRASYARVLEWYQTRMAELDSAYIDVVHDPFGGWSESDHERFCKLRDEYATEAQGRHTLLFERLRLELPKIRRKELLHHEDVAYRLASFKAQKHSIKKAFEARMAECMNTTRDVYQEATKRFHQHQVAHEQYQTQLSKLEKEHFHLKLWREEKIAHLKALEARRAEEMEDKIARETEEHLRTQQRRQEDKQRIKAFHDQLHEQTLQQMEMAQRLRAEEETGRAEQAKYNEQRSQYRQECVLAKIEERKKSIEANEVAKLETARRLEALRESVAVHVDSDWERILSDTQAVSHAKNAVEEPPLFTNNSFTVEHVLKDRRAKLALALHDTGLMHNQYARDIIRSLGPSGPVRRDMKSSWQFS